MRQRAEYREFFTVTPERARDVLNRARTFDDYFNEDGVKVQPNVKTIPKP